MSCAALVEADKEVCINPILFMKPTAEHAWTPFTLEPLVAHGRARWGAEERGQVGLAPKCGHYRDVPFVVRALDGTVLVSISHGIMTVAEGFLCRRQHGR